MPGYSREDNARLRLMAMQQSRATSPRNRSENLPQDLQALRAMSLLVKGAQDVRAMQACALGTSYEECKKLVYTLIETRPKFPHAKLGAAADTFAQLVASPVPAAINAVGQFVAKATGSETVGKIVEGAKEVHDATDGLVSAAGTFVSTIPPMASTVLSTSNSALVQQCMTWWMSANAAANATTLASGYLGVLSHISTIISVLVINNRLDPMLALEERYRGTCSCCDRAAKIAQGWMDAAAASAASLNPIAAVGLSGYRAYDKLSHRIGKMRATPQGKEVHRDAYYIACALWDAAQANPSEHEVFQHRYPDVLGHDARCPLAMLILATLFGEGNCVEGAPKAVAAIIANRASAVEKIKALVG
ncbi:hypothetical protein LJR230_001929 [Trinickia sp. LjRoot230]|uniref:hypothetical protein n=1 Tax=Trinickia sp. LjRoot230 TaxID=3342288 RepID=UPI003ECF5515